MKRHAEFLNKHKLRRYAIKKGMVHDPSLHKAPVEELQMVEEKSDEAVDDIVGIHESDGS